MYVPARLERRVPCVSAALVPAGHGHSCPSSQQGSKSQIRGPAVARPCRATGRAWHWPGPARPTPSCRRRHRLHRASSPHPASSPQGLPVNSADSRLPPASALWQPLRQLLAFFWTLHQSSPSVPFSASLPSLPPLALRFAPSGVWSIVRLRDARNKAEHCRVLRNPTPEIRFATWFPRVLVTPRECRTRPLATKRAHDKRSSLIKRSSLLTAGDPLRPQCNRVQPAATAQQVARLRQDAVSQVSQKSYVHKSQFAGGRRSPLTA